MREKTKGEDSLEDRERLRRIPLDTAGVVPPTMHLEDKVKAEFNIYVYMEDIYTFLSFCSAIL